LYYSQTKDLDITKLNTLSIKILMNFLKENGIDFNYLNLIKEDVYNLVEFFIPTDYNAINYPSIVKNDIIYQIINDLYNVNSKYIKIIAEDIYKQLGIKIGYDGKNIIKKILNYNNEKDIKKLKEFYPESFDVILEIIEKHKLNINTDAKNFFINNFNQGDNKKKRNYLYSIFIKLFHFNELTHISLPKLFNYNERIILKELEENDYKILKRLCKNNRNLYDIKSASKIFYFYYLKILKRRLQKLAKQKRLEPYMNAEFYDKNTKIQKYIYDRGYDLKLFDTEEYDLILFNINQEIYEKFDNEQEFYNYILEYIKECYRVLSNHKVLVVWIKNVYNNQGKNLKWDIYSKVCIFGERFIPIYMGKNFYYNPEVILYDILAGYNIDLNNNDKDLIKKYYQKKIDIENLIKFSHDKKLLQQYKAIIESLNYVYSGFTFNDCFILKTKNIYLNKDLPMIKNNTELLIIFYKYRIDNRKIPCPECGGLKVSGNSFPEIGHKSWECKNEICPSRSKSNRGKRYSEKTNYMQWGVEDKSEFNIIPKEIINKWRRDIVTINENNEVYEMILRYYSFPNEKVLFINADIINNEFNRNITYLSNNLDFGYKSCINLHNKIEKHIKNYFNSNSSIFKYFIIDKKVSYSKELDSFIKNKSSNAKVIQGDSFEVLQKISENSITAIVTSPPYYNVRDYSKWSNLYLYFYDMYNIIKQCYRVLKPGGIFLWNIGDVFDNERIIVKSTMGYKRINLGAYFVFLFQKIGFELLENIIWDKGEAQSNRHKNNGNLTPHYQKPINAYEHMFIFKKPGSKIIINKNYEKALHKWCYNVVKFPPVIKINAKGENIFGHSAPFPHDIPDFVVKLFSTNEDDIILDPFAGSGTSIISAYKNNRIGIGIELNEEYVKLCMKKLRQENINFQIVILDYIEKEKQ